MLRTKQDKGELNFIDLFAGAGGLSCGLEMAGFHCILGVESNPSAVKTFRRNHPRAKVFSGDIKNLTIGKLRELIGGREVHLVAGGPPCQGFSTAGRGDPLDGRNSLFLEFVRIVRETNPLFVLLENVTGLVAGKNNVIFKTILECFGHTGHNMDVQVMSAQHYGVAQRRRRTIFMGTRINPYPRFPVPTHGIGGQGIRPIVTLGRVLGDIWAKGGKAYNHDRDLAWPSSQDILERIKYIPEGQGIRYQRDEIKYLPPELYLGVNWEEMAEGRFRQVRYHRLHRDRPSPTILTQRDIYFHPTEDRYLTLREAAKIQSFPNDFVFEGAITSQWQQIGNAVPPLLAKSIGESFWQLYQDGKKSIAKPRKRGKRAKGRKIELIRSGAFSYGKEAKTT